MSDRRGLVDVTVPADEEQDDCLTAAQTAYIEAHPDLVGYDLSPRWTDADRETVTLSVPRSVDMWWSWHDQDQDRWSSSTEEAEHRAARWACGQSDDGPTTVAE